MIWNVKFLIAFIGGLIAGMPGAAIGLFIGFLLERPAIKQIWRHWLKNLMQNNTSSMPLGFLRTLFQVMGYLAKSDGRVSKAEIAFTSQIMAQLRLSDTHKKQAILWFNQGKNCTNIYTLLSPLQNPILFGQNQKHLFLEIQKQLSQIGSAVEQKKKYTVFLQVYNFCHPGNTHHSSQRHSYQHHNQHRYRKHSSDILTLHSAYVILGVTESDSDKTITLAYRRKMNRYHPDKLAASNPSPSNLQKATEKTRQIKSAYDLIKKARNIR